MRNCPSLLSNVVTYVRSVTLTTSVDRSPRHYHFCFRPILHGEYGNCSHALPAASDTNDILLLPFKYLKMYSTQTAENLYLKP